MEKVKGEKKVFSEEEKRKFLVRKFLKLKPESPNLTSTTTITSNIFSFFQTDFTESTCAQPVHVNSIYYF